MNSQNEVKLHVGATNAMEHGPVASDRKFRLAAELARGLSQSKARAWQHRQVQDAHESGRACLAVLAKD